MRALLALVLLASLCARAHAAPRLLGPPIKAEVDYSCRVDADCAIKDVGNCCGRLPACVNKDSPTFPERVREECAQKHEAGVCGFPDVRGCACVEGRCSNRLDGDATPR
jgi:hypothetical protein